MRSTLFLQMSNKLNDTDKGRLNDLPVTLENTGFAPDEMIACGKCRRSNPPNRLKCFYCGSGLAVELERSDLVRPTLRKLEEWEKGFNLVLLSERAADADLRSIAGECGLELDVLKKIVDSGGPMPLARVESEPEATIIRTRLKKLGIESGIVSDEVLDPARPPKRVRGIEFADSGLTVRDFNTDEKTLIAAADLFLLVTGSLFELKTHSFEKRKKGKARIVDQSDTSTDEAVIDIYASESRSGFRIYQSGFDFSCLGSEKGLIAADNLPKLLRRLTAVSPAARLVDNYSSVRDALDAVWELNSHKDFEGLRRSGFGKTNFGSMTTVSNDAQFNRFSRMQRQLWQKRDR
jgi:hypothetical protein